MTQPTSDEWSFAEFDGERRAHLESDMPFDKMAQRIADLAVVSSGCVDPLRTSENPAVPAGTTWRAWFTINVADEAWLSDLCFNGRDGVRGRYWVGAADGDAATASMIALLREKLLQFAAHNPERFGSATLAGGDLRLLARSLDAASAKVWAYEEKSQRFDARPRLIVKRWANQSPSGDWRWAPSGPLLDIKGAFYTPDDREFVLPEKRERARSIHLYGFS
ncbi:hypothetical protein G6321_00011840 [Bradyrhizobium barranii subsp. barranii]|uniref:Uncharacterized protein n=1 Tax=Bradyrhizobium barranii subsp. barranii TaxID=2823807 RepID=A0A7Z0Q6C1_9BRAD|nr:hypothetical protein [Bradyrhizobium barranii]UGX95784.1 hypothetical protein G6321_00011840 [Bradyrhizobium barranii subsp. barranii]